jgi:hypothetical protein
MSDKAPMSEVDVVRMRPGHRADLVVNQQHGGVVGCKGGFVHFLTPTFQRFPNNPIEGLPRLPDRGDV